MTGTDVVAPAQLREARSRLDAQLDTTQPGLSVPLRRESYSRTAMAAMRRARGRMEGDCSIPAAAEPIAEFVVIADLDRERGVLLDVRNEAARRDGELRSSRLAVRAAAILDQLAADQGTVRRPVPSVRPVPIVADAPAATSAPARPPAASRARRSADAFSRPTRPVETPESAAAKLRVLAELRDDGMLTVAQFEAKRAEILARF